MSEAPTPVPAQVRPGGGSARSKARKRALDILFESEARAEDPLDVLRRRISGADAPPVSDFAQTLVEGVVEHREHIDASLGEMARGWSVERMAAVDRAILRIGAFEVLFTDDVDDDCGARCDDERGRLSSLQLGADRQRPTLVPPTRRLQQLRPAILIAGLARRTRSPTHSDKIRLAATFERRVPDAD